MGLCRAVTWSKTTLNGRVEDANPVWVVAGGVSGRAGCDGSGGKHRGVIAKEKASEVRWKTRRRRFEAQVLSDFQPEG